jgi:hypothetical protein
MSAAEHDADGYSAVDAIAGLIAVGSVVLSAFAMHGGFFLGVDAHPGRTAPIAIALAIVAGRMSERFERTARRAMFFAAFAWVVGMTIAVVTDAPLF